MRLFKTIIVRDGLLAPRFSEEIENELFNVFTFKNPQRAIMERFSPYGIPESVPPNIYLCETSSDRRHLRIPRGFNLSSLSLSTQEYFKKKIRFKDDRVVAPCKYPVPLRSLNKEQEVLSRSFSAMMRTNSRPYGGVQMISPTGTGKTIALAECARLTKETTLILVPTNLIRDAWYDDLSVYFGLTKKDIGIIQGSKFHLRKPFTIAMIPTLCRKPDSWSKVFPYFGAVLVDECHTSAQTNTYDFLYNCPAKWLIGATATDETPYKYKVSSVFGVPIARIENTQEETETSYPLNKARVVRTKFEYAPKIDTGVVSLNFQELLDCLSEDDARNNVIVENAFSDWEQGHSVIITTRRVAHAYLLASMMEANGVPTNVFSAPSFEKPLHRQILISSILTRKARMIIASEQIIRLGANLNPLDRLHIATPIASKTNLEQLIGRIRRKDKSSTSTKTNCGVTYYLDDLVPYLRRLYYNTFVSVCKKLKVKDIC